MNIRNKRKNKTSNKIMSFATRPRLMIFRSSEEIYASIIDSDGKILASANSIKNNRGTKVENAGLVGSEIAKLALSVGVKEVVFDRRGYRYHGRVAELAKAARDKGLKF